LAIGTQGGIAIPLIEEVFHQLAKLLPERLLVFPKMGACNPTNGQNLFHPIRPQRTKPKDISRLTALIGMAR
jgi:hypothetical protein